MYRQIHQELVSALIIQMIREVPHAEYKQIYDIERANHEEFRVDPDFDPSDGRDSLVSTSQM